MYEIVPAVNGLGMPMFIGGNLVNVQINVGGFEEVNVNLEGFGGVDYFSDCGGVEKGRRGVFCQDLLVNIETGG